MQADDERGGALPPGSHSGVGPTSEALFVRWRRDRDLTARDELVTRFLPLARKLARRYSSGSEPYDDLLQVASLGLVKAVDRFDPSRGVSFASFAVPTILGELKRYFRDLSWAAHVPRGAQELARKVGEGQERLTAQMGRSPTVAELAEYLELGMETVVEALDTLAAFRATSLDAIDDGPWDERPRPSTIGNEDERLAQVDDGVSIAAVARGLSERERQILLLRFYDDRTQSEIAQKIGISQMQVSRILRRALEHLNQGLEP